MFAFTTDFLERLAAARDLNQGERKRIADSLGRLEQLLTYMFTAIELPAELDVEQVSEVFVRVNSQGTKLNQADFLPTLLSVYWDEGRKQLEDFSRRSQQPAGGPGPFNYFLQPGPDQLLRVSIGLGLRRANLRAVYQLLQGRGPTGSVSADLRAEQLATVRAAQEHVLDLTNPKPSAPVAGVGAGVRVGLWLLGFRGGRVGGRAGLR